MEITAMPRTIVRQGLRGLRVPLDVTESLARRAGVDIDEHWLPSVMFEGFEADTKRVLGSLLRDDELTEEGRRQRAKAAELRQALRLEAVAGGTRARADARLKQRRQAAAQQRKAIAEAARETGQSIEEKRRKDHAKAQREAEHLEEVAEEVDEARNKEVARAEREARRQQLAEETAALAKERRALEAEDKVRALSEAEEHLREQRRSGS